jgi:4'-phosphopantetheinyl transferase
MGCDNHSRKDPQIDLWCAFAQQIANGALLLEYRRLLTEHEREREQQMHFARDRRRYLVTRALVRIALSKYAPGVAPHEWAFTSNRYGKPEIANPAPQAANLTFNITHSGQLIVVGVARGIALGGDTENVRVRRAPLDIADDYFTSDGCQHVRRCAFSGAGR